MVDAKGVVVDTFEMGGTLTRSDVVIKSGGIHTLRAVVTDEASQVSTNACTAQVDVKGGIPIFVGGYFGKERLTHDDAADHDDIIPFAAFSRCAPLAGLAIGFQPRIGDNAEFEAALGVKFPFDDDSHTTVFGDAAVNRLVDRGFFGGGVSFWDIGKDSSGVGLLLQGGFDLSKDGKWQLVGQTRVPFFNQFDNIENNYQFWGGIRFKPEQLEVVDRSQSGLAARPRPCRPRRRQGRFSFRKTAPGASVQAARSAVHSGLAQAGSSEAPTQPMNEETHAISGSPKAPPRAGLLRRLLGGLRRARRGSELPSSIGRYRVVRKIGEGGMGTVFEAEDEVLGRRVAIKRLKAVDESGRRRFWREARAAARLAHPNVCPLYEVGEDAAGPFLAMELMLGEPLSARLRRGADGTGRGHSTRRGHARRAPGDPRRGPRPPRPQALERLPHAAWAAAARFRARLRAAGSQRLDRSHPAHGSATSTAQGRSPTPSC